MLNTCYLVLDLFFYFMLIHSLVQYLRYIISFITLGERDICIMYMFHSFDRANEYVFHKFLHYGLTCSRDRLLFIFFFHLLTVQYFYTSWPNWVLVSVFGIFFGCHILLVDEKSPICIFINLIQLSIGESF